MAVNFTNIADMKRQQTAFPTVINKQLGQVNMPSVSKAQQVAMQIAEHAPDKLYSRNKGMLKMSHQQLHDFASGSEKGKPERKPPRRKVKWPTP